MSKITGTIVVKSDVIEVSDKFKKIEFVVETEEQYAQKLQIQFTQDKCDLMKYYKVGDVVDVNVNLKGREWLNPATGETKYFLSLDAWSISKKGITQETAKPRTKLGNIEENFQEEAIRNMQEDDDDLPF
jgi:hypothetical protein